MINKGLVQQICLHDWLIVDWSFTSESLLDYVTRRVSACYDGIVIPLAHLGISKFILQNLLGVGHKDVPRWFARSLDARWLGSHLIDKAISNHVRFACLLVVNITFLRVI